MKTVEDLKASFKECQEEIAKIDSTYDFLGLDMIEGRAVKILQLMEVQIGEIGSEMYSAIKMRRAAIAQGKVKEPKAEPKAEPKEKTAPKKKAKKAKK